MAQGYTVTASTSIVLVSSIEAPNTVVLLSSIQYPGHIIGVRDVTGSNEIAQYPVIISTMNGLKFYDGTSSILLNQPNGYLSFSSRDRSTWQLLNSFGFLTTLSTGFVETLTTQRAFVTNVSSTEGFVSSMTVANVFISKSFEVLGNTSIEGDIGIGGSLNIFSSLHVFESLNISSSLTVGGDVNFPSSLTVRDGFSVGSNLSTFQNLFIGNELVIDKSLYTERAFIPSSLSVQTLTVDFLTLGGGFQLAGGISTTHLSTFSSLTVLGKGTIQNATTISAGTAVFNSATLDGQLVASSIRVENTTAVGNNVQASTLTGRGGVSTLGSAFFGGAAVLSTGVVFGPVYVKDQTEVSTLSVGGNAFFSSMIVSSLVVSEYVSSYGSTFTVSSWLNLQSSFVIGNDLVAGFCGEPFTYAFFSTASYLSSLSVQSNLFISSLFTVNEHAWVGGSMDGITNLTVGSNVSTTFLTINGNVFVNGDTNVRQILVVDTLGAPIRIDLSTLVLSNTLTVGDASIPLLETDVFAGNIFVGQDLTDVGFCNLYVDGILQNRDVVRQPSLGVRWTANSLRASTLQGSSNISTTVIGPTTFEYPIGDPSRGILVGGKPNFFEESIFFANNISTPFYAAKPNATLTIFFPRRIRYNGTNRWVAVGDGLGGASGISIMYSVDGYNWGVATGLPIVAFPGIILYDVAYGNGRWVATGTNSSGAPNIFYSDNGISWTAGTNTFTGGGFGRGVAFNGTLWVVVGSQGGTSAVKYSNDGATWINGTIPMIGQFLTTVVWTGSAWWAFAGPTTGTSYNFQSLNGATWTLGSGTNQIYVDYMAYTRSPVNPNQNSFICVGSNLAGMTTSIAYTNTELAPQNFTLVGQFTGGGTDIFYDSNTSQWYISGYNLGGLGPNLVASSNLTDFFTLPTFVGSNRTVAAGTIQAPAFAPYFTPNVTSIFHSTLSSQTILASTVNASSFQGSFFGSGALLTNITRFADALFTSSIQTSTIKTNHISTFNAIMTMTSTMDTVTVNRNTFFSSANIFLAAGNDSIATGNIQVSQDGSTWTRAFTSSFNTYGNAVMGTSNQTSPFYIAAGADTRKEYTIQYSVNGFAWNPVETGGFDYESEEGYREAKDIAYNSFISRWVAVGVDTGGTNTIQYSDDGRNFTIATNGFQDFGTKVVASPYSASATNRFVAIGKEGIKYSSDGVGWFDALIYTVSFGIQTPVTTTFTAIAPGRIQFGIGLNGWIAVDIQNRVFNTFGENEVTFYHYIDNGNVTQGPVSDVLWLGGAATNWVAVGSNVIQRSATGLVFTQSNTLSVLSLNKIVYNTSLQRYVIGATTSNQSETIFTSSDLSTWISANPGSGFSTIVAELGEGYGVASLGASTFAVGKAALTVQGRIRPSILNVFSNSASQFITEVSLTASNASNLFTTAVRGIAATSNEINQYVVVGDASVPQKTIARSPNAAQGSWIPAITGGFSTTGYGVTYYNSNWIAVGDAQGSRNTIQYSADAANWFGTNNAPGIRLGGRGIASREGFVGESNIVIAVGKDTTTSTILYSYDGFYWSTTVGSNFNVQGNGVVIGKYAGSRRVVAVGEDTRASQNTVLTSTDGVTWTTCLEAFVFGTAGYGVAYGEPPSGNVFVAVGDGNAFQGYATIFYSYDGSYWTPAANTFTGVGYGVTFNTNLMRFFAVGRDCNGDSPLTIKHSQTGTSWENLSTGFGFLSQKELGSANGLFTQATAATESFPYMLFSNLVIYDRETPLLYPYPSIRVSTTGISLTEGLFVRSSLQLSVGTDEQFDSSALTVSPFLTYASQLVYTGEPYISSVSIFSTIQISTLLTGSQASNVHVNPFTTPLLSINPVSSSSEFGLFGGPKDPVRYNHSLANNISPAIDDLAFTYSKSDLYINDTFQLQVRSGGFIDSNFDPFVQYVLLGPKPMNPIFFPGGVYPIAEVNVDGSFATSSLSTTYFFTASTLHTSTSGIYFKDEFLTMFEGLTQPTSQEGFTIQTTPSSMTFQSLMTLQVSTQKVGVFTSNPRFELDVQRLAIFEQLVETKEINASLLFYQFQTF